MTSQSMVLRGTTITLKFSFKNKRAMVRGFNEDKLPLFLHYKYARWVSCAVSYLTRKFKEFWNCWTPNETSKYSRLLEFPYREQKPVSDVGVVWRFKHLNTIEFPLSTDRSDLQHPISVVNVLSYHNYIA